MKTNMKIIDLRSDTVTKPSIEMRKVMANADVGDDVFGEDPTVNQLESLASEILDTEAAIFVPSGTQSNLLALLSHCERGDEYIVGQQAHTYKYEGGGAAVFGSIQPQPLDFEDNGTLSLEKVFQSIKPDDYHFARTRLLCLENTQNGKPLPLDYLEKASIFARDNQLKIHLDGARLFNAVVKNKISAHKISHYFDTISFCLSKGLGAPVGSLLCGNRDTINDARRWRKVLGGGMRQSGILAAAGIYAINNNIKRLSSDHSNADLLVDGLLDIEELEIDISTERTNMVFVQLNRTIGGQIQSFLAEKGIIIRSGKILRLVTHMDINEGDIHTVISAFKSFISSKSS